MKNEVIKWKKKEVREVTGRERSEVMEDEEREEWERMIEKDKDEKKNNRKGNTKKELREIEDKGVQKWNRDKR